MDTMPKATRQVVTLLEAGRNQSVMARHINLRRYAVGHVYQRYQKTGGYTQRGGSGGNVVEHSLMVFYLSQHHCEIAG